MGLTIRELLPLGEKILRDAGVEDFKNSAEALLGFETGFGRTEIFLNQTHEVDETRREAWFGLLARRAAGEPLQYITGEQYFMGHRFSVDPSVLIPRPETELLAEKAIEHLRTHSGAASVLDLCTGSGALAVSIAKACPHLRITASDVSAQALAVAGQNAAALGVSDRIDFVQSDLFASLTHEASRIGFDLIVTNPPYVRTNDFALLAREIRDHEPVLALDGGADGLDFYRRIAADARDHMLPGACLMTEIGADQGEAVSAIFAAAGFTSIDITQDLNDFDRIIKMQ